MATYEDDKKKGAPAAPDFSNTELGGMAAGGYSPDADLHSRMAEIKAQVDAIRAGGGATPAPEQAPAQAGVNMNLPFIEQSGIADAGRAIARPIAAAGTAIADEGKSFMQRPIVSVPGAGVQTGSLADAAGIEFTGADKKNFAATPAPALSTEGQFPQPGAAGLNKIVADKKAAASPATQQLPDAAQDAFVAGPATANTEKPQNMTVPGLAGSKFDNSSVLATAAKNPESGAAAPAVDFGGAEPGEMFGHRRTDETRSGYVKEDAEREQALSHNQYETQGGKYAGGSLTANPPDATWAGDDKNKLAFVAGENKTLLDQAAHSDTIASANKKIEADRGDKTFDQDYKLADLAVRKDNNQARVDQWRQGQEARMTQAERKAYNDSITKHEEEKNKITQKLMEQAQLNGAQPDPETTQFQAERYVGGGLMYGPDNKTPGYGKRDSSGRILSFTPFGEGAAGKAHYQKIMSLIDMEKKAAANKG